MFDQVGSLAGTHLLSVRFDGDRVDLSPIVAVQGLPAIIPQFPYTRILAQAVAIDHSPRLPLQEVFLQSPHVPYKMQRQAASTLLSRAGLYLDSFQDDGAIPSRHLCLRPGAVLRSSNNHSLEGQA